MKRLRSGPFIVMATIFAILGISPRAFGEGYPKCIPFVETEESEKYLSAFFSQIARSEDEQDIEDMRASLEKFANYTVEDCGEDFLVTETVIIRGPLGLFKKGEEITTFYIRKSDLARVGGWKRYFPVQPRSDKTISE